MASEVKPKKSPKKKDLIIAGIIIFIAFFGTFGVFWIMKAALNTQIPLVVVTSGSMEPTIYRGDLLIVQGKDPADIKNGTIADRQGDIIIYDSEGLWSWSVGEPIVHRVVNKSYNEAEGRWYFVTKGDNNGDTDPPGSWAEIPVPEERILGVVVTIIPKVGWVKIWLTDSGMGIPLIVILGILLIISIVWDLTHPEDEEKDEKEKGLAKLKKDQKTTSSSKIDMGI
jgi:signal peptidase